MEKLLSIAREDSDNFKEIIDNAASFSGGNINNINNIIENKYTLNKYKNVNTNKLDNLENLKNLVGGKIHESVLKIALLNNENNVYTSLQSLLNTKTRQIYELLAKNKN